MRHPELETRIAAIETLMAERLYLNGSGGLPSLIRQAKGRLSRAALHRARELADVRAMLASPAAAGAVDPVAANAACDTLEKTLRAIPEGKYRRRAWSGLVGRIVLQLLVVFALVVGVMVWRDLI